VEKTVNDFLGRKVLLRNARGELPIKALRFIAAADLVGLDTAALRRDEERGVCPSDHPQECPEPQAV
jgi:hypothetical protein